MRFQVAIANIPPANSGSPLSFNLPGGIRLFAMNLYISANGVRVPLTATNVQRVRIFVDTVTLVDCDLASLLIEASRRGISLTTGQLPIYFADPLLVGLRNANSGTIDMKQGIGNVQVQVTLGTITTPSLTGELIYDNQQNIGPVFNKKAGKSIMQLFNTPLNRKSLTENVPTAAGYTFQTIYNPAYPLDTIVVYDPAFSVANISQITYLTLSLDKVPIFQGAPLDLADEFKSYGIVTPNGTIVLPFTYDRFSPGSAAGCVTCELNVNCSAGQAYGVSLITQMPSIT